jgi:hypothetical protein
VTVRNMRVEPLAAWCPATDRPAKPHSRRIKDSSDSVHVV